MILQGMVTWLKKTSRNTFPNWFPHSIISRTSTRTLRKCTQHAPWRSSFSSWTPKERAEFTLRTCWPHRSLQNSTNCDNSDTPSKSWTKTGSQCHMPLPCTTDSTNSIRTRTRPWERRTSANTLADSLASSLTVCTRSTRQSTANLTSRVSWSSFWPCKTRNLLRPSNTSGEFSTCTTRAPSTLSSSTCSSGQSFRSFKLWKSAVSTLRT